MRLYAKQWWHIDQNNTGGSFLDDEPRDVFVWGTEAEANALFEIRGYDDYECCWCCGPRWGRPMPCGQDRPAPGRRYVRGGGPAEWIDAEGREVAP